MAVVDQRWRVLRGRHGVMLLQNKAGRPDNAGLVAQLGLRETDGDLFDELRLPDDSK